jgi:hypothetical protein
MATMTDTEDETAALVAKLQIEAELNPSGKHAALLKQAATVITELWIFKRVTQEISKQEKLS